MFVEITSDELRRSSRPVENAFENKMRALRDEGTSYHYLPAATARLSTIECLLLCSGPTPHAACLPVLRRSPISHTISVHFQFMLCPAVAIKRPRRRIALTFA